jgi:hypothetical protein
MDLALDIIRAAKLRVGSGAPGQAAKPPAGVTPCRAPGGSLMVALPDQ